MPRSDAQKQADKVYDKKIVRLTVKFNPNQDSDKRRLDWLNAHTDKTALIKGLIDEKLHQKD